jgi:hypothetical protein
MPYNAKKPEETPKNQIHLLPISTPRSNRAPIIVRRLGPILNLSLHKKL